MISPIRGDFPRIRVQAPRYEGGLRGGGQAPAEGQAAVGGPLCGQRVQGRAMVCLGVDRHRLPASSPAGPPPSEDRQAGLSLLLRPREPAADQDPADQGSRAALARGGGFPVREALPRPGLAPDPALHCDPPPHRAGHGRLAICAVTAAQLKDRTGTQPPRRPSLLTRHRPAPV